MIEQTPDIPRIFTGLAEWLSCFITMLIVKRRIKGVKFAALSFAALLVQVAFMFGTWHLHVGFWIPTMVVAWGLMFLYIKLSADITAKDGAYYCARAFIMAEFASAFEWQIHYWIWPVGNDYMVVPSTFLIIGVYGAVFISAYFVEKRAHGVETNLNVANKELFSAGLMAAVVFALSNLSFVTIRTPFSGVYGREIMNMRTMIDLGGVALLYAHYTTLREHRAAAELTAVSGMFRAQYTHYQLSKDNIEVFNRKYHDLKHQIAVVRAETDEQRREALFNGIEDDISNYETQNKTGNPVLDTILTSKSLYCAARKINMTCVADGALLDFMEIVDICALFGNALDNAIESAEKIEDKKRRLIHLTVTKQKNFLIIKEHEIKLILEILRNITAYYGKA